MILPGMSFGTAMAGASSIGSRPEASPRPCSKVGISSARQYDYKTVYRSLREVMDSIGGLGDIVRPSDKVAIKVNLTGGIRTKLLPGLTAVESFATHPQVVRVLCELLKDAGAGELLIVEAVPERQTFTLWGYEDIAPPTGTRLVDLNRPHPHRDFALLPVGGHSLVYSEFTVNHLIGEVDVFISVSKLKQHRDTGVTHTMKNLVGLVPLAPYARPSRPCMRSAFHDSGSGVGTRLVNVIVDLNRVRPIDLGVVDGIKTVQGGEATWIAGISPIAPGVVIAGKNAVCVDAVATAVMGFDPTAEYPQPPFSRSINHLKIARDMGLGTNRLDQIEVVGHAIDDVRTPFNSASA